ncbi:hypothetical protein CASFOL_028248 [Castilleja foliolosa]|uniref:Replication protein A 70 kDa DNA-binding subunit B/D first OB fold domain-containing protein n=1 Tax=Castilleja foliolosa TaxID=1961234 RepID=A0ABD3CDA4_9LAMI
MAPLFRLIKDVDRNSRHALKLRVVRIISRSGYDKKDNKSSLEIVFHDQEGGRMTGIVKKMNVKLFESRLTEGRVYGIRNYYVENNSGNFRTSLAKFKIVFNAKTMFAKFPDEHFFPDFMFDFRPFSTLVDINNVDVIGKVNEIHNPQDKEFSGKRARLIEIILEDLSGHQISCTLWGSYVDQILTFESNLTADPPVLILQMCRAKIYRDKVTLSNSFEVTQIHTRGLDIEKFSSQIKKDDSEVTKSISRGSLNMSKIEMDDLADGKLIFYPVDNFYTVDEACSFWICSIISSFIGDWCGTLLARGANESFVKLMPIFFVMAAENHIRVGYTGYKLQLEVLDSTANASLLCWDREAEKLIGKSCHELSTEILQNPIEFIDIPDQLARLIDQTVLFKNEIESDFVTLMMREENGQGMDSEDEVTTPVKKADLTKFDSDNSSMRRLMFDEECVGSTSGNTKRVFAKAGKRTLADDEDEPAMDTVD